MNHRIHRLRQQQQNGFRTLDLVDWVDLLQNEELHLHPSTEEPGPDSFIFVPRRREIDN